MKCNEHVSHKKTKKGPDINAVKTNFVYLDMVALVEVTKELDMKGKEVSNEKTTVSKVDHNDNKLMNALQ